MKKLAFILSFFIPSLFFAQNSRDINTVIQKTIDLHALKQYYSDSEKSGDTPLIIINDDKIPNNLIVFKFNKRVKIMTTEELETFKSIYKGNLDSYFVFEIMEFKDNEVTIKATFRKTEKIAINVNMKKENNNWLVTDSKAG
jgi:predicted P-loop ATPase